MAADRDRTVSRRAIAWADGRVVPGADATVPLLDDGVLHGDGVRTTVLVRRGRTFALDRHLEELRDAARRLGFRLPVVRPVVGDLLAAWGGHDGLLTLIATRPGVVRGLVRSRPDEDTIALHVVEAPWRSPLAGVATLSEAANRWARRQARAAHADDAVVVDGGLVCELPHDAVCVVRDGRVVTPDPALGPVRRRVLVDELVALADVEPAPVRAEDLLAAEEVFAVSVARPVVGIHAIDDVELPAPGPVTTALRERLSAHVDASLDGRP